MHIVADFVTAGGGREHAFALRNLLTPHADVGCWSEEPVPPPLAREVRSIRPFSAEYPVGGTLIAIGPQRQLAPWISRSRASRIVLVCNASEPRQLCRQLACIRGNDLPEPQISYVSERLHDTIGLPGRVNISPVTIEEFLTIERPLRRPLVGRHSRDVPGKHHPLDFSLYRQLALNGLDVRIMGGSCLAAAHGRCPPGIELLPFGHSSSRQFIAEIDIYFYRTHPALHETASRSVLEAMAGGLPVIASTAGGYCDWLRDGETGFLVSNQDEAFDRIMETAASPALRKACGEAARAAAIELSGPAAREALARWYLDGR